MATSVKIFGGFFRLSRASASTCGIRRSRAVNTFSRASSGANVRLMIVNALLEMPLE